MPSKLQRPSAALHCWRPSAGQGGLTGVLEAPPLTPVALPLHQVRQKVPPSTGTCTARGSGVASSACSLAAWHPAANEAPHKQRRLPASKAPQRVLRFEECSAAAPVAGGGKLGALVGCHDSAETQCKGGAQLTPQRDDGSRWSVNNVAGVQLAPSPQHAKGSKGRVAGLQLAPHRDDTCRQVW